MLTYGFIVDYVEVPDFFGFLWMAMLIIDHQQHIA